MTALLSRYVENSSPPPSVEDKQPQVLELGESSNMQYLDLKSSQTISARNGFVLLSGPLL